MTLFLNESELEVLRTALDGRHQQLFHELNHADSREFKQALRDELLRLEALQQRLNELSPLKAAG